MNFGKSRSVFLTACMVTLALIPCAEAQTGSWQAVENLPPGREISVKTQRRYFCILESVNDAELVCEVHPRRNPRTSTIAIPRAEVREVREARTLPNQRKSALIGAGIGAGSGAIVAGVNSTTSRGANAFFGGLAGAGIGAVVGATVPVFQVLFKRGKLIYRR